MNKKIYIIGDTHGKNGCIYNHMSNNPNSVYFHVGDFGLGFKGESYDLNELNKLNRRLTYYNSELHVIRGNHDDPSFFNGMKGLSFSNLFLHNDYDVVSINDYKFLMVGGAISIDRKPRISRNNGWWENESFNLDIEKLEKLRGITHVITHSAPSFVEPHNDFNNHENSHGPLVEIFVKRYNDIELKDDLNHERKNLDLMWHTLKQYNTIKEWFYGHFHNKVSSFYQGTTFNMLNINEIFELDNE